MPEARIVLFADTHLGFDYPVRPRVERRRRGPDFFANFHRVLDYARETRPDAVVHGGDLFFRARVPQVIVDMVYRDLFEFAGEGIPLLIVPGNHERSILPVSLFLGHPNLYIFDKPQTFTLDTGQARLALSGFPCQRKEVRAKFTSLLQESGWGDHHGDCQLLCLHQTIEGARVGPSGYTFRHGEDVIPRSQLPQEAAAVLCGHIHRQQVLGGLHGIGPPVLYPGSIERTSFAEKDENKGFYDLRFSRPEGGDWSLEETTFIQMPARPMVDLYLEKNLDANNVLDFIQAQVAQIDPQAVIRLRCHPDLEPSVRGMVTSRVLREMLPETINYQFSSDFHQWMRD